MNMIDTHTHLYLPRFDDDRKEVVLRAREAGVDRMLMPNIDSHTAGEMMAVSRSFPGVCIPMMGLHPTSVKENYRTELDTVGAWFEKEQFAAVGETGIDLHWDTTREREQKDSLEQHIHWALRYDLPLVLHSRNSLPQLFDVLQSHKGKGLKGVFHCFPGTVNEAKKVVDMGFCLGIGGVVTYKGSRMAEVVRAFGLDTLLLETDAPYLAPVPHRGKRNESAYLRHVAEKVAELKGVPLEDVAAQTTENARMVFRMS